MKHEGVFEGENDEIWIDKEGNEYNGYSIQTRLYSYDATVENMMNYRCDLVYANCENEKGETYWITDTAEYFDCKAKADADDHKSAPQFSSTKKTLIYSISNILVFFLFSNSPNLVPNTQLLTPNS